MFFGYSTTVLELKVLLYFSKLEETFGKHCGKEVGGYRLDIFKAQCQNFPCGLKKMTSRKPNPGIFWTHSKISKS
jgi:hypothetical protein